MERPGLDPIEATQAILKGRFDADKEAGDLLKAVQDKTAEIDGPVGRMAKLLNSLRSADTKTEGIVSIKRAAFRRDATAKSLEEIVLVLPDGTKIRTNRTHLLHETDPEKCYEGMFIILKNKASDTHGSTAGIRVERVQNGEWQFYTSQEKTTAKPDILPIDEYKWEQSSEAQVDTILTHLFPE